VCRAPGQSRLEGAASCPEVTPKPRQGGVVEFGVYRLVNEDEPNSGFVYRKSPSLQKNLL
jgi:hypothetical protein